MGSRCWSRFLWRFFGPFVDDFYNAGCCVHYRPKLPQIGRKMPVEKNALLAQYLSWCRSHSVSIPSDKFMSRMYWSAYGQKNIKNRFFALLSKLHVVVSNSHYSMTYGRFIREGTRPIKSSPGADIMELQYCPVSAAARAKCSIF